MPGYSATPLAQKLGIKPGHVLVLLDAPEGFESSLEGLPRGIASRAALAGPPFDVALVFVTRRRALERRAEAFLDRMPANASVWVCWPKKASGVPTGITEQTIRDVALPLGLVDIKVCAVSDVWSGLKLMIRRELRASRSDSRARSHAGPCTSSESGSLARGPIKTARTADGPGTKAPSNEAHGKKVATGKTPRSKASKAGMPRTARPRSVRK